MIAMTNELKNVNNKRDEDLEELLTFRKEHEERKRSNSKEDVQLLAQQVTKLERELHEKNAETIRHDSQPYTTDNPSSNLSRPCDSSAGNNKSPDIPSLENDLSTDA